MCQGDIDPWDLPLYPSPMPDIPTIMHNRTIGKGIPRHLWVAFKNIPASENRTSILTTMLDRAAADKWTIHLMDAKMMDSFMEKYMANTSTLWAYNQINPQVGPAKGDLWRYCMLYLFGGAYMDDDSYIGAHLDEMVGADDQLILSWEKNNDPSLCFKSYYHLSKACLNERFHRKTQLMFGEKILIQWFMMSIPRHELFKRTIETAVASIRAQYLGVSFNYMHRYDRGYKWIFCTTGPPMMTAVAREVFLEQEELAEQHQHRHALHDTDSSHQAIADHHLEQQLQPGDANYTYTYTLYGRDFGHFGGQFKVVWSDPKEHYMHRMETGRVSLLRDYHGIHVSQLEGKLVSLNGREFFYVMNGTRMAFQDWDAFVDNGFNIKAVMTIPSAVFEKLPLNKVMVQSSNKKEFAKEREDALLRVNGRTCVDPFAE